MDSLRTKNRARYNGLRLYLRKAEEMNYNEVLSTLAEERRSHRKFNDSWTEAARMVYEDGWTMGLTKEQCTALKCYTLQQPNICREFNRSCRNWPLPTEWSWSKFPFKSLWCLLVDAFKRLPKSDGGSRDFYRGMTRTVELESTSVCFAQFVSASPWFDEAEKFKFDEMEGNVLTLKSVPVEYFRDISEFSIYPGHEEVLMWPLCVFECLDESVDGSRFVFREAEPIRERVLL